MRRVDTPRGTVWLKDKGMDIFWVYADEAGRRLLGSMVVVGREIDEVKYTWSAGHGDGAPNGAEDSEAAALVAILASAGGR